MIDKASLEQFLRINGINPPGSDEEIKSVLLSARWDDDDVDTAMIVLRENKQTHTTKVDSLHKVFRSDERLTPDSVSHLLGIDMDMSDKSFVQAKQYREHKTFILIIVIGFITFAICMSFVAGSMWMLGVGPFHQTVTPL